MEVAVSPREARDAVEAGLTRLGREDFSRRLWARDPTLWGPDPARQQVARTRLGWLDAPAAMREQVAPLQAFAAEAARDGFTHAVLLGMGGSSLAPEVLCDTFGVKPGALHLTVLDSTSPAAVRAVAASHDPARTLFVVSSKSGATLEVSAFERYFHDWVGAARGSGVERAFVAITDPGSPLEDLAHRRGYRRVFLNPSDIGGRYSALSFFGLVPAALIGVDVAALLDQALAEERRSAAARDPEEDPGLELGAALGELALRGRDKVTLILGSEIGSLASWIEQLLAESTGKDGKGLIPIAGEPLGSPEVYGPDRLFVAFGAASLAPGAEAGLDALAAAGHPVLRWRDPGPASVGAEFLRWEIATAAAASVLGINPFDEPNVTEAKQATRVTLDRFLADGRLPERPSLAATGSCRVEAPSAVADAVRPRIGAGADPAAWAAGLLSLAKRGDYVALLAYFRPTPARRQRLDRLRLAARGTTRLATTLGYGPRFLHSTGQLHKGGPNTGIFLQLTADEGEEVAIPGERFGFRVLIQAQAAGDYEVLERRGRRVMRIHLGAEPERALDEIAEAIAAAPV